MKLLRKLIICLGLIFGGLTLVGVVYNNSYAESSAGLFGYDAKNKNAEPSEPFLNQEERYESIYERSPGTQ